MGGKISKMDEATENLYAEVENSLREEIKKDASAGINAEDDYNPYLLKRLYKTREHYIALRTRLSSESESEVIRVIQDWMYFLSAIQSLDTAMQLLHVDIHEGATDRFEERVRDVKIVAKELEQKFERAVKRG